MITNSDTDVIQGYVDETMLRIGCKNCEANSGSIVEVDGETGCVRVSVPDDSDPGAFCDILAHLLERAGYTMLDVWIDQWNPTTVNIDDKEDEVP